MNSLRMKFKMLPKFSDHYFPMLGQYLVYKKFIRCLLLILIKWNVNFMQAVKKRQLLSFSKFCYSCYVCLTRYSKALRELCCDNKTESFE